MKKFILILISFTFLAVSLNAQFKGPNDNSKDKYILGIFDPQKFTMQHSFQINYITTSYGSVSLTSYVNSMNYKISDKLNVSADITMQYSPYANSSLGKDFSSRLQSDMTGIYLSRLSLDYKISDNTYLNIQFRRIDGSNYYDYYSPFNNNFGSRLSDWR
jgi:hypothetical protein